MAVIFGTPDNDTITGTAGADSLNGMAGNDTVRGGGGVGDSLRGGLGDDRLDIGAGAGFQYGDEGDDTLIGAGDLGSSVMTGGVGNDVIEGHADIANRDFAAYIQATSGVVVDLRRSDPQDVGGGQGIDTVTGVWGVFGSHFGDRLIGGGDRPLGGRNLIGLGGDDTLQADNRGAILSGGEGDDLLLGGMGIDSASYAFVALDSGFNGMATSGLTISLAISGPQGVGGGLGVDTLRAIEQLVGSSLGDTLSGDGAANGLSGGSGDDRLTGAGGDDILAGEFGDDTVLGGDGDDVATGFEGANLLRGEAGDDSLTGGGQFDDVHGNTGADTVVGGVGDDWVRGGRDDDSLSGDGGADFLSGDRGADTLSGGAGADTFHTFGDAGLDRVLDFNRAQGDRVLATEGASWTVTQQGADVVIDLIGGARMILVGVQLSTLTDGWISGG